MKTARIPRRNGAVKALVSGFRKLPDVIPATSRKALEEAVVLVILPIAAIALSVVSAKFLQSDLLQPEGRHFFPLAEACESDRCHEPAKATPPSVNDIATAQGAHGGRYDGHPEPAATRPMMEDICGAACFTNRPICASDHSPATRRHGICGRTSIHPALTVA